MNRLLFIAAVLCFSVSCTTQKGKDSFTAREAETDGRRDDRKSAENLRDSIRYEAALQALKDRDFVVEADQLVFKRGRMAFVNSATNFVALRKDQAVIQVAPFRSAPGPNGVGGITVDGQASNITMKTDKKGRTYFSMNVMGTGISATVDIMLMKGSNKASVTVNPNFNSNRITLNGNLVPSDASTVFKGRSF